MNISDKYRYIFLHIPKAAATSIKEALELPGSGHLPWQYYYMLFILRNGIHMLNLP